MISIVTARKMLLPCGFATGALLLSFGMAAAQDAAKPTVDPASSQDEIKQFCTNIADPARDQRYLLQKQELDKLQGKVVKITQAGKEPAYWFAAETAGAKTNATIKLHDAATAHAGDDHADAKVSANNLVFRLLMRAYKALSGRKFQAARELAGQAGTLDPRLAAPQLIKGLAFYQEGNVPEARAALAKAQADNDAIAALRIAQKALFSSL